MQIFSTLSALAKPKVICSALVFVIMTTTNGCTDSQAQKVSKLISEQADKFDCKRHITVINCPTGEVTFELTGYFSIQTDTTESQLEITEKTEDARGVVYLKHFIYLNENTSYNVEGLTGQYLDDLLDQLSDD